MISFIIDVQGLLEPSYHFGWMIYQLVVTAVLPRALTLYGSHSQRPTDASRIRLLLTQIYPQEYEGTLSRISSNVVR